MIGLSLKKWVKQRKTFVMEEHMVELEKVLRVLTGLGVHPLSTIYCPHNMNALGDKFSLFQTGS